MLPEQGSQAATAVCAMHSAMVIEWQFMTGGQWVSHPGGDGISYWGKYPARGSALLWKVWRISPYAVDIVTCMDPAVKYWQPTFRFPIVPYYHISNEGKFDMPVA